MTLRLFFDKWHLLILETITVASETFVLRHQRVHLILRFSDTLTISLPRPSDADNHCYDEEGKEDSTGQNQVLILKC